MTTDERYLQRAIDLARLSRGYNQPNPPVGSVVVYKDTIIGEGYHQQYGQAHAEVNAIAAVQNKELLKESCIYVTLEPCHHFGKTPPCVDLILKYQIPRVVIACQDPYVEVAGKSIEKLRQAGVEVLVGLLEEKGKELNRRFFTFVQEERPYIVLKYAVSADGFMGQAGKNVQISNNLSKRLVHKWRSEEAAIMVGSQTALVDNPQLNNRFYFGRQPLRVVVDRSLRLPHHLAIFDGTLPTWIYTQETSNKVLSNVQFHSLDPQEDFLNAMLKHLYQNKIQSLLVEGGAGLLNVFLEAGLWDEARIIVSNKALKTGIEAPIIPKQYWQESKPLADNKIDYYFMKKKN